MPDKSAPKAGGMSPLARLLNRLQSDGLSFREMERIALQKGFRYSSTAFENVAKDALAKRLGVDALRAIAAVAGEDVATIARLDDERWGIPHAADDGVSADDLRYKRPEGVSDTAWARIKQENASHLDYLIEKAAKER